MAWSDITSRIKRSLNNSKGVVPFTVEGCGYMFEVQEIGNSGFEVKVFSSETAGGDEILTLAGGTPEDTTIDVRLNDHNLNRSIRFNIYHMSKCKCFYERNKNRESHKHFKMYRDALLKDLKK